MKKKKRQKNDASKQLREGNEEQEGRLGEKFSTLAAFSPNILKTEKEEELEHVQRFSSESLPTGDASSRSPLRLRPISRSRLLVDFVSERRQQREKLLLF